jgi:HNH endonuclease
MRPARSSAGGSWWPPTWTASPSRPAGETGAADEAAGTGWARAAASLATLLQACLDVVSGPGGIAGYLRGALLNAPFSSLSQPLDIGRTTRTIPAHLRAAVIPRDRHCQFPGCTQPASVCDVHHLIHWAHGGPTSLHNLALYCRFHHLIVIHRWGWAITRHPDGTRTATAPDGRTLHSHSPPQQAA